MFLKKKNQTSCYTYFRIAGDFNPDEISAILNLTPFQTWQTGEPIKDGRSFFEFSCWKYGLCDTYNVYVEEMMKQTIADLTPKIDLLNSIRDRYPGVHFCLEIVPSLVANETTPCLAPNREVIEFCYLTHTDIDIDLYVS